MNEADFFAQAALDTTAVKSDEERHAELAGLLVLYLRNTYDDRHNAWTGRDDQDTLRRTCHAVEVLHRLNLDEQTAHMVREGGNWLINLPARDHIERNHMRMYPSRFKTLAYLGRFDDAQVRRDFSALLQQEVGGMLRGVTESDVMTSCITLDTLLNLEQYSQRREVCPDERREAIVRALRQQFHLWKPAPASQSAGRAGETQPPATARRPTARSEIVNARDLSYTLGLLLQSDHGSLRARQLERVQQSLLSTIQQSNRKNHADIMPVLYAALQLAEHFSGAEPVRAALADLLKDVHSFYATPDIVKRWDFSYHTLLLRLLVTIYEADRGEGALTRLIAGHFVREAEGRRKATRDTFEVEIARIVHERIQVRLDGITELSGGFTGDHIYRVPFSYWAHAPGQDGTIPPMASTSIVIKSSTSDAFDTATKNYAQLPEELRDLFVRQPTRAEIYHSEDGITFYLPMEDLTDLQTFHDIFNELDQPAMSGQQSRLLHDATPHVAQAAFKLFQDRQQDTRGVPGTQLARLYLAPIEKAMVRAIARTPWLKNPTQSYFVNDLRLKGLDYYLTLLTRQANMLQPRVLGLVHGDFHSRNIMLDHHGTHAKLIDLDKLSWSGDYLSDLGNLLADICVYRRVSEPDTHCGLPREDILFVSKATESKSASADATAENAVRYSALGRPATRAFQDYLLQEIEKYAQKTGDANWKPRLWLAAATALFFRLQFHAEKEVVAVLYGEGARWLHELSRFLEHSQPLPAFLVPLTWQEASAASSEMPTWITQQEQVRRLHNELRKLGLRPESGHESVRYHAAISEDGPFAVLLPARDGVARLLLRADRQALPETPLRIIDGNAASGGLDTMVIIAADTAPSEVLRLVRAALEQQAALAHSRNHARG